ncbi:MAG: hypothetical protein ABR500_12665 [Dermatophilaceae bacterium]
MRPDSSSEAVFAQWFHEEALLTAGLSHHNIATLFDYSTEGEIAYLVMEFVEGVPSRPRSATTAPSTRPGSARSSARWRWPSMPPTTPESSTATPAVNMSGSAS